MTQRKKVSPLQEAILRFIWRYLKDHNRPPVYREIESAVGVRSVSVIGYHVQRLESGGFLRRARRVARGLSLTEKAMALLEPPNHALQTAGDVVRFPIRGTIQAGEPVDMGNDGFNTYDDDDAVAVDGNLLPRNRANLAALRVRGNSMIDALVQEGDIVILQADTAYSNGDMVAAWLQLEQELTLKHFHLEGAQVRLQPANPTMAPIYTHAGNVTVQGKVLMVLRPPEALQNY